MTDVEPRTCDTVLWRVCGPRITAGFLTVDEVIVEAAPYLAKVLGMDKHPNCGRWCRSAWPQLRALGTIVRVGIVLSGDLAESDATGVKIGYDHA